MPASDTPASGSTGLKLDLRRAAAATAEKNGDRSTSVPQNGVTSGNNTSTGGTPAGPTPTPAPAPATATATPAPTNATATASTGASNEEHPSTGVQPSLPPKPSMDPLEQLFLRSVRPHGKTIAAALVESVLVETHPSLTEANRKRGVDPWDLKLYPGIESCVVSVATHIPADHYLIKIGARLAKPLVDGTRPNNQCHFYPTVNYPSLPEHGNDVDSDGHRHPWWEVNLTPGVNTIHLYVVAGPQEPPQEHGIATRGSTNPSRPEQYASQGYYIDEIDLEHFILHIHVLPPTADHPAHIRQRWGMP
jgi:hypothetical protein